MLPTRALRKTCDACIAHNDDMKAMVRVLRPKTMKALRRDRSRLRGWAKSRWIVWYELRAALGYLSPASERRDIKLAVFEVMRHVRFQDIEIVLSILGGYYQTNDPRYIPDISDVSVGEALGYLRKKKLKTAPSAMLIEQIFAAFPSEMKIVQTPIVEKMGESLSREGKQVTLIKSAAT